MMFSIAISVKFLATSPIIFKPELKKKKKKKKVLFDDDDDEMFSSPPGNS